MDTFGPNFIHILFLRHQKTDPAESRAAGRAARSACLMEVDSQRSGSPESRSRADVLADLPNGLRLLCVAAREPAWTSLVLRLDAEGCVEPRLRWVSNSGEALTLLRDESFDCILLYADDGHPASGDTRIDASSLISAIRGSGCDDPVVLVSRDLSDRHWQTLCEAECEVFFTSDLWESPGLVPIIKRAINRAELFRENHRLAVGQHRRLVRERDEAEHLLCQQRLIIGELARLAASTAAPDDVESAAAGPGNARRVDSSNRLPPQVYDYYQELLRTYVIMGSGSLGREIAELAELIAVAGLCPREALELHLERVESLIHGLGSRSCRHVMARADLLALELMMHLGECYQRRWAAGEREMQNAECRNVDSPAAS